MQKQDTPQCISRYGVAGLTQVHKYSQIQRLLVPVATAHGGSQRLPGIRQNPAAPDGTLTLQQLAVYLVVDTMQQDQWVHLARDA